MKEVLIIEDNAVVAKIYSGLLEASGLKVALARDGEEGLRMLGERRPDGVLLDLGLPKVNGIEVLRHIRQKLNWSDVPVVISTATISDRAVADATQQGATRVLEKACTPPRQIIEELIEVVGRSGSAAAARGPAAPERPGATDDTGRRRLLTMLSLVARAPVEDGELGSGKFREEAESFGARLARGGEEADAALEEFAHLYQDYFERARVMASEREAQYGEALKMLRELAGEFSGAVRELDTCVGASSERLERIAAVEDIWELKGKLSEEVAELRRFVVEKRRHDEEVSASFNRRIEGLQSKLSRARAEAEQDSLTKLRNRGAFDRALADLAAANTSGDAPFALVLFDLDDFKRINDTHGHPVGDRVIMTAADWINSGFRPTDFVARYGGEEFAVLLKGIPSQTACRRVEHILERIATSRFQFERDSGIFNLRFTASCGLACARSGETGEQLLERADAALYSAKRSGKNRMVLAD